MAHTVIGTAGHIDHGKTQLVRALTGIDTDRTREERERGITIELGFAHFDANTTIIDVPGHERFVKTMVAGVSTIDVALLVIAADDGVMPQTREHLDVLQILGVERGIVALNKVDLVDDEWLDLVEDDIRGSLQGTFLESAPIRRVSALKDVGIDELSTDLRSMLAEVSERSSVARPFRLPVDRAFSVHGFGVVATGTAICGQLQIGDEVEQLPDGRRLRVRGLQCHGEDVKVIEAGARTAINLAGANGDQVLRGDTLAVPGSLRATSMLDVDLRLLASAPKAVEQRTRIRLHIGTVEVLGRVVLLQAEPLIAGERAMAQIRLEKPVVAAHGDRFVVRRYSPAVTIGGGVVLDPQPQKHREGESAADVALAELVEIDLHVALGTWTRHRGRQAPTRDDASAAFGLSRDQLQAVSDESGEVISFDSRGHQHLVSRSLWESEVATMVDTLDRFHRAAPQEAGMPRPELARVRSARVDEPLFMALVTHLEKDGQISLEGVAIRLASHEVSLTADDDALATRLTEAIESAGWSQPPDADGLAALLAADAARIRSLLHAMERLDRVVFLDEHLFLTSAQMADSRRQLEAHLTAEGEVSVSDYRKLLGTNRRYALALLNHFDAAGVTDRDSAGVRTRRQ
ncbi:MAG: selenocysteine-specific translation elongation factor [Gemmatimonadetes bacterium]|nr:selenocysteine-specific translation elongation factor [Gemmatimonadota bacterium]MBT6147390.1 selenocysteine-specific translation elongation factor [Gemmatimonadota bacterium]MBT7863654.1 selenocysteine-specific translation elongation factor [Gemmatimonadota bacterium]